MKAKYPATCWVCRHAIAVGAEIMKKKHWRHVDCKPILSATARVWQGEAVERERRSKEFWAHVADRPLRHLDSGLPPLPSPAQEQSKIQESKE